MSAANGRSLVILLNDIPIAGVRQRSLSLGWEEIDVTNGEEIGYRHLLGVPSVATVTLSVSGIAKRENVNVLAALQLSKQSAPLAAETPSGRVLGGRGIVTSFGISGSHKDYVAFDATMQLTGAFSLSEPEYGPGFYAEWDPATHNSNIVLSNDNLTATRGPAASTWASVRSTVSVSSGRWYWEYLISGISPSGNNGYIVGIAAVGIAQDSWPGGEFLIDGQGLQSRPGGAGALVWNHNIPANVGANVPSYVNGDVIGIAIDGDTKEMTLSINGVYYGDADYTAFPGGMFASVALYAPTVEVTANFGASPMVYAPPSGYTAGLHAP